MQTEIVKVPRQFVADFETVATFYKLAELGELEAARAAVKRDTANAIVYYARFAGLVREGRA